MADEFSSGGLDEAWQDDAVELAIDQEQALARAEQKRRSAAELSAKAGTALVAFVSAAVIISALSLLQPPSVTLGAAIPEHIVPPGDHQRSICPGSFVTFDLTAEESGLTLTAQGEAVRSESLGAGSSKAEVLDKGTLGGSDPISAVSAGTELLTIAQSNLVETERIAGFTAIDCRNAAAESWLLGASTATGRNALMYLLNPTGVPTPVDLTFYSEDGRVGSGSLIVPAGSQIIASIAAYAPGHEALAVKVASRGAPVTAYLGNSVTRILRPGGVDLLGAVEKGATQQTITPVVVTTAELVEQLGGQGGWEDLRTVLQLFIPGSGAPAEVTFQVRSLDETGAETEPAAPRPGAGETADESVPFTGITTTVQLERETMLEIPLETLPNGKYVVEIISEEPVLAGVRSSSVRQDTIPDPDPALPSRTVNIADFSWVHPGDAFSGDLSVPIPSGPDPSLELWNPGEDELALTLRFNEGVDTPVIVPARSGITVPLAEGIAHLSGLDETFVSVSFTSPGMLAGYELRLREAGDTVPIVLH